MTLIGGSCEFALKGIANHKATLNLENIAKDRTKARVGSLGPVYSTSLRYSKSGEGVVSSGTVVQVLDYYPFGDERIDVESGTDEKRKFAGMERDDSTGLDYAMARYYDNTRGQFISQDPVFREIGESQDGRMALLDPQSQNSYSWAKNNPVNLKDPDGRFVPIIIGAVYLGLISEGDNTTDRHYIGERFDSETELNYLNSRYYRSAQGQFLSQDPTFLAIGDPSRLQSSVGVTQDFVLRDPQVQNSYSYGRNNPITMKE